MNPFGVDDDISKHLIGHHTRPTDRHTRDQHKMLRRAKNRVSGEYYLGVDRAGRKAGEKWDSSKEGKADAYARTFHEATRGNREDYTPLPPNPSRQNAVNAGIDRWKGKPKAQNLAGREARLQRAYRNKPVSKGFGVHEPLLSAVSKGSVDQGLRMVSATTAGKGGPAVRLRSRFAGAKRRAGQNKVAASARLDQAMPAVNDAYRVARQVESTPAADYMNRAARARQGQLNADMGLRQAVRGTGQARFAASQISRGPGYAASDGARSLQWQARQAANAQAS